MNIIAYLYFLFVNCFI